MKILITLNFVLIVFIAISCDSSPATLNNDNDKLSSDSYFPVGIGSWWLYKTSYSPGSEEYSIDSIVITGMEMKDGKNSYKFVRFVKDKNTGSIISQSVENYFVEGSKIFKSMQNSMTSLYEWLPFVDFDKEIITIYKYEIVDGQIENEGVFNGYNQLTRTNLRTISRVIKGDSIKCLDTKVIEKLTGMLTLTDLTKVQYEKVTFSEEQSFALNIGLIKRFDEINAELDMNLIDYHIAKAK